MGSPFANGGGERGLGGAANGSVDKGVDYANYFCTYSYLYHQKEMLSDRVRMDAYYNSIFQNTHHFQGKVYLFSFFTKLMSLSKFPISCCNFWVYGAFFGTQCVKICTILIGNWGLFGLKSWISVFDVILLVKSCLLAHVVCCEFSDHVGFVDFCCKAFIVVCMKYY